MFSIQSLFLKTEQILRFIIPSPYVRFLNRLKGEKEPVVSSTEDEGSIEQTIAAMKR
jgi:hypothetical protein